MNWTKTPPTEPGYYYWDLCEYASHSKIYQVKLVYNFVDIGLATVVQFEGHPGERVLINDMGGFWFGRVPAPGTTFTVEQVDRFLNTFSDYDEVSKVKEFLEYPVDGLAAVTECNRKGQG